MEEESADYNPPLMATYKHLLDGHPHRLDAGEDGRAEEHHDLTVIDLALLDGQAAAAERCRAEIVRAALEWGFFQVTNHGVPEALLRRLHDAQVAVFRRPFQSKARERLLDFSPESYRWGTPTAKCLEQLSWSEAYHIPITSPPPDRPSAAAADETRLVIEEVSAAMSRLAQRLAWILIGELGVDGESAAEMMRRTRDTCFLRLNRYPACGGMAMASGAFGLCPHTDSDFLTVLHLQHAIAGLQLLKAGRWVAVNPNPNALIVNVGDLLQAWSNDMYRSVEHRVMASATLERFSVAFFLCPSYDTLIRSHTAKQPEKAAAPASLYRSFTFGEYRNQIREDVRLTGRKVGLQRFLLRQDDDPS